MNYNNIIRSYQPFDMSLSQEVKGSACACEAPKPRAQSSKVIKSRDQLRDRLSERIIHHPNEMSIVDEGLYCCIVLGEFLEKNPDIQLNHSKHRGLREALGSQEVRRTLVKIGSIFVDIPGYNWELGTSRFSPHPLSIVPINSEFHNAELAYIAIKSHRRSSYNLHKARAKRRHIIVIIIYARFNPPMIFLMKVPFLNPYSCPYRFYSRIESIIHRDEVHISH